MTVLNNSALGRLAAISLAAVMGDMGTASAQNLHSNGNSDAVFRAQVRQQMQMRSLRQRLRNEDNARRAIRSAERAARAEREARRRARSR